MPSNDRCFLQIRLKDIQDGFQGLPFGLGPFGRDSMNLGCVEGNIKSIRVHHQGLGRHALTLIIEQLPTHLNGPGPIGRVADRGFVIAR